MASTNKTTNYELSQYVGTDKPTYLGDYNSDMSKIDTAIHNVATNVGTESARIGIVENNIGTMADLDTTDKSSLVGAVNEVNTNTNNNTTNIGTLSNLETTNKTNLVNAINEVLNILNINTFETINNNDITLSGISSSGISAYTKVNMAFNSDKSLYKLYGVIRTTTVGSADQSATNWSISFPTSLRPSQAYTIVGGALLLTQAHAALSNGQYPLSGGNPIDIDVATNGVVSISGKGERSLDRNAYIYLPPCIYLNKSFGD